MGKLDKTDVSFILFTKTDFFLQFLVKIYNKLTLSTFLARKCHHNVQIDQVKCVFQIISKTRSGTSVFDLWEFEANAILNKDFDVIAKNQMDYCSLVLPLEPHSQPCSLDLIDQISFA